MKKLFIALLLILSANCYGQFTLKTGVGVGVQVFPDYSYDLYQTTLSVTPEWRMGDIIAGAVSQTFINDSLTSPYLGTCISYPVWKQDKKYVIIAGQYLFGTEGRQLIGGTIGYNNDIIGIDFNASQEYKSKTGFFTLTLNYYVIQ